MKQLIGPFQADKELCPNGIIKHLGIQVKTLTPVIVILNSQEIELGQTGMYELKDVAITSLKFKQNMDNNTIIEYVLTERT